MATSDAGDLPWENVLALPDRRTADACAAELRSAGADVDDPVHESGFRRWTVVVRVPRDDRAGRVVAGQAGAAIRRGGWHLGAS